MGAIATIILLGAGGLGALVVAAKAEDGLFAAHAWVVALACLVTIAIRIRAMPVAGAKLEQSKYLDGVVRAGAIATLFWGTAGFLGMMYYFVPKRAERQFASNRDPFFASNRDPSGGDGWAYPRSA